MFIDWLIHIGIELFIICLSLKLFCLINNVYVTCISFAQLISMFIGFVLIENYKYIHWNHSWFRRIYTYSRRPVADPLSFKFNNAVYNFFVSGYIGRSISLRRKRSACRGLFVNGNEHRNIDDSIPDENKQIFFAS